MLRVKDIVTKTGWSEYRVLKLISLGKLPAVNTGAGKVPRWEVREEDLQVFLTPKASMEALKPEARVKKATFLTAEEEAAKAKILSMV